MFLYFSKKILEVAIYDFNTDRYTNDLLAGRTQRLIIGFPY